MPVYAAEHRLHSVTHATLPSRVFDVGWAEKNSGSPLNVTASALLSCRHVYVRILTIFNDLFFNGNNLKTQLKLCFGTQLTG
jgi:hypothetical protein